MEYNFCGCTMIDLWKMAFMLGERTVIKTLYVKWSWQSFVWSFLNHHKLPLSIQKPCRTSFTIAFGFNNENCSFFQFPGKHFWTKLQCWKNLQITWEETFIVTATDTITIIASKSASGTMFLCLSSFQEQSWWKFWLKGVPKIHWMSSPIWLGSNQSFWSLVKTFFWKGFTIKDSPVLLILDGNYSHVCNSNFIKMCRKNNTIILLPPHLKQKLQPLGEVVGALHCTVNK